MRLFQGASDVASDVGRSRPRSDRVVWQAASVCLSYPGEDVADRAALVRAALREAAPSVLPRFADLLATWESTPVGVLQARYVEVFDLSGKQALYLSYWTDGDTRRRGQVLTDFKARYRRSDFLVNTHGELPDYLPLVLEYGAVADPADGAALMQEYRASLELLRLALVDRRSEHAGVVTAVCDTLPGASPATRQEVHARAKAGPPVESVGLDPYDPRLLPLSGKG
jgi:nitrate reductase delta subunit